MTVGSVLSLNTAPTECGLRVTDSVDAVLFILVGITHCLLGRIMERFAFANPPRFSLAGIEMAPKGTPHGGEVVLSPFTEIRGHISFLERKRRGDLKKTEKYKCLSRITKSGARG